MQQSPNIKNLFELSDLYWLPNFAKPRKITLCM